MHEIVTLQFGPLANYVGAHYFNIEDEMGGVANADVDLSVSFETVESRYGTQLVPRCVMIDGCGAFGSASMGGTLWDEGDAVEVAAAETNFPTWGGRVEKFLSEPVRKNEFLQSLLDEDIERDAEERMRGMDANNPLAALMAQLGMNSGQQQSESKEDDHGEDKREKAKKKMKTTAAAFDFEKNVSYFTDYLKVHMHKKSMCQLSGIHNGVTPTNSFATGYSYAREYDIQWEDATDRFRHFAEACDAMQGIQVLSEEDSLFGGVCARYMEELRDEYPKTPIMSFGLRDLNPAQYHPGVLKERFCSSVFSANALQEVSSLYIPLYSMRDPLSFHGDIRVVNENKFMSSAVLASAMHSATTQFRSRRDFVPMGALVNSLCPNDVLNTLSLSFDYLTSGGLVDFFDSWTPLASVKDDAKAKDWSPSFPSDPLHTSPFLTALGPIQKQIGKAAPTLISQSATLRGAHLLDTPKLDKRIRSSMAKSSADAQTILEERCNEPFMCFAKNANVPRTTAFSVHDPLPIPVCFPQFFKRHAASTYSTTVLALDDNGVATDTREEVTQSPCLSLLHSSFEPTHSFWKRLRLDSASLKYELHEAFERDGISNEHWLELSDSLLNITDSYSHHMS